MIAARTPAWPSASTRRACTAPITRTYDRDAQRLIGHGVLLSLTSGELIREDVVTARDATSPAAIRLLRRMPVRAAPTSHGKRLRCTHCRRGAGSERVQRFLGRAVPCWKIEIPRRSILCGDLDPAARPEDFGRAARAHDAQTVVPVHIRSPGCEPADLRGDDGGRRHHARDSVECKVRRIVEHRGHGAANDRFIGGREQQSSIQVVHREIREDAAVAATAEEPVRTGRTVELVRAG